MDGSFLSKPDVIAASRQFICMRLATYEDEKEGAFLKAFKAGRGGELENSVFCILGPDGKEQLVRPARGIGQSFSTAAKFADGLNRIADTRKVAAKPKSLPLVKNFRLALDVAAADNRPLVVLVGQDDSRDKVIAKLAWSDAFVGQFIYVMLPSMNEAKGIVDLKTNATLAIIESDKFGLKGKILGQCLGVMDSNQMTAVLKDGLSTFHSEVKTFQNHVREGHKLGVFWDTVIPVTDREEQMARERGRGKTPKKD